MRVLIPETINPSGKKYLAEKGYEVLDDRITTVMELREAVRDCDGMIVRILPCGPEVIEAGKKLRVIAKHGVGVDNIDVPYCTRSGVQVTITPEAVVDAVAEHALYLIFACAKNATYTVKHFVERGDFDVRSKIMGVEVAGKTVGILGLGRIGRSMVRFCLGVGLQVLGHDPFLPPDASLEGVRLVSRDELLRESDFVSLHLPCNDETRGKFGAREFGLMQSGAFFINVSRGGLVREQELIEALRKGSIRGAGIDVYEREPVDASHPLLNMENVVATPHQAGSTIETTTKVSLHAAMCVDDVLTGKTVRWPLNHPV